jgi:hypothetical protein
MKKFLSVFSLINILFAFISIIVAVLAFIISYDYLPKLGWPNQIEKIIVLVLLFAIIFLLAKLLRLVFIFVLICFGSWFTYQFYSGKQNLLSFYNDSRNVFNSLTIGRGNESFEYKSYTNFYRDREVVKAIDYKTDAVRNFALEAVNDNFRKEQNMATDDLRVLIQSLAVFKKINSNWNYVSDPDNEEFFAKASESVKFLAGDCDDYSVLMAAAIKSIGGKVRLTFITGHIYPELFIGTTDNIDPIGEIITKTLFKKETKGKQLYYYTDKNGNAWLNLDYTAKHPGGNYMGTDVVQYIYP